MNADTEATMNTWCYKHWQMGLCESWPSSDQPGVSPHWSWEQWMSFRTPQPVSRTENWVGRGQWHFPWRMGKIVQEAIVQKVELPEGIRKHGETLCGRLPLLNLLFWVMTSAPLPIQNHSLIADNHFMKLLLSAKGQRYFKDKGGWFNALMGNHVNK